MDKIWLKSYPPGIPAEIDPEMYESLVAMFDETCERYASQVAFQSFGAQLTFKRLHALSEAFACGLQSTFKLQKGDRLGIMLPNVLQYPIVVWGALKAGLVVVNINPQYTERELLTQLLDSECHALVVLNLFYPKVAELQNQVVLNHILVTEVGDYLGLFKGVGMNLALKCCRKAPWFVFKNETVQSLRSFIQRHRRRIWQAPEIFREDIAFLQYTGGTTGVPKGAMLNHHNLIANVLQAEAWLKTSVKLGQEVIITALPLYHIFSLMANALLFFKLGAVNVLITNPKDIKRFVGTLKKTRFTAITGVNTLFNALLNHPQFETLDFTPLKIALGGGMAVQRSVARQWQRVTGVCLLQAYGLTEASPAVCINPISALDFSESVGLPIPSTTVKICDDKDRELALGEEGELWVKGPQVMIGYWRNPEETEAVLTNGWLKTGDIASVDNRGFVKIVDRKKELILVSGFNVYPNEVEAVIAMHPAVKEVGVVGVTKDGEEIVTAFIVKKLDTLTEKEVFNHCRKFLTNYKVPKKIEFRTELPKSLVGKILRRALR